MSNAINTATLVAQAATPSAAATPDAPAAAPLAQQAGEAAGAAAQTGAEALNQAAQAGTEAVNQAAQALSAAAPAVPPAPLATPDMGFLHFVAQSDFVGKTLFIILIVMSLVTWYLIVVKVVGNMGMRKRAAHFLNKFWNASSLEQVENEIVTHGARDPFSHLASHAMQRAAAPCQVRRYQAGGKRFEWRVRVAHHAQGHRRGNRQAGERPDGAGFGGFDRAVRGAVRHSVGRVSRAGRHRPVRWRDHQPHRRPGGRGPDHDRPGPGGGHPGGAGVQRLRAQQPGVPVAPGCVRA